MHVRLGELAEVRRQQLFVLVVAQLVVDREVGEIEEAVAHAGVLPVDDLHVSVLRDEVRVQQVVVARALAL